MKESPITPLHVGLGAVMEMRNGWRVPMYYTDLVDEHLAARSACGMFDVSHLSKFHLYGERAAEFMEKLFTDAVLVMKDGESRQSLMLNYQGVIIDKVVLARESAESFFVIGSSCQEQTNEQWLRKNLELHGVTVCNDTEKWCAIALMGPESERVFHRVADSADYPSLSAFCRVEDSGDAYYLSRAGVFDKDGVDIYCAAYRGIEWFEALLAAGAVPCGMKTHDYLRMVHGEPAVDNALPPLTPESADMLHLCGAEKEFLGSEAVWNAPAAERKLVSLRCAAAGVIPARGDEVLNGQGEVVGTVMEGGASPALNYGVALAMADVAYTAVGTALFIQNQTQRVPCTVAQKEE